MQELGCMNGNEVENKHTDENSDNCQRQPTDAHLTSIRLLVFAIRTYSLPAFLSPELSGPLSHWRLLLEQEDIFLLSNLSSFITHYL